MLNEDGELAGHNTERIFGLERNNYRERKKEKNG